MSVSRHLMDRNFFPERRLRESGFSFFVIQNFCGIAYIGKHSKAVNPVSADFELLNYFRSLRPSDSFFQEKMTGTWHILVAPLMIIHKPSPKVIGRASLRTFVWVLIILSLPRIWYKSNYLCNKKLKYRAWYS